MFVAKRKMWWQQLWMFKLCLNYIERGGIPLQQQNTCICKEYRTVPLLSCVLFFPSWALYFSTEIQDWKLELLEETWGKWVQGESSVSDWDKFIQYFSCSGCNHGCFDPKIHQCFAIVTPTPQTGTQAQFARLFWKQQNHSGGDFAMHC